MKLAILTAEDGRNAVEYLVEMEVLPSSGKRQKAKPKVLLSRKPQDFVASVVRLLGLRRARANLEALTVAIREIESLE